MDPDTRYRITTWRKRLEHRGWISLRRQVPPRNRVIEYHVIWRGRLFSGRVLLAELAHHESYWQPGTPVYLLERGQDVEEGVWRLARDPEGKRWQVARRMPL